MVSLGECGEELVDDPFLFDGGEKGTGAERGRCVRCVAWDEGAYLMRS